MSKKYLKKIKKTLQGATKSMDTLYSSSTGKHRDSRSFF